MEKTRRQSGGRYIENRGRYIEDGAGYTESGGRYREAGNRYTGDSGRYTENVGRYGEAGNRYTGDSGRYMEENSRYTEDRNRYTEDSSGYTEGGNGYMGDGSRYSDKSYGTGSSSGRGMQGRGTAYRNVSDWSAGNRSTQGRRTLTDGASDRKAGNRSTSGRRAPFDGVSGRSTASRSASGRRAPSGGTSGRSAGNRSTSGKGRTPRGTSGRGTRARRQKKRSSGRFTKVFLIVFLLLLVVCGAGAVYLYRSSNGADSRVPEVTVSLESLDSPYAVLMDAETGRIIGSKKSTDKIFPASMAKIMTVLTAIENIKNLDSTITMSYDYYEMLYERDASRAGFEPGEEAVIRDLLYGALLPSGAECCMELALQAAGSQEAFAQMMNQRVEKMGLVQTHFANSTGLHDEAQYSTVEEIGKILCEALKNRTFYKVFTTKRYTVQPTEIHPDGFTFESSMFKGMEDSNVIGGEILGGKTGYTDDAGYCLASMAEIEGRKYVLVTAGWAADPRVDQYHINDAFLGYNELGRALASDEAAA